MRKHIKHLRNEKGLTLIELLAVIVILGIIAAIAIPMIGNVVSESREKAQVNEALNIISAAKQYYAMEEKSNQETVTYTITSGSNPLANYININPKTGESIEVSFNGTEWSISGHDANTVVKDPATETDLQNWLKNGDENTESGS